MSDGVGLLIACVIPGCTTLVARAGDVCDGCKAAFGPMLVHAPERPAMTVEQIERRDVEVAQAYLDQRKLEAAMKRDDEGEVRSNQICWLCEERRRCTRIDGQWECSSCAVRGGESD